MYQYQQYRYFASQSTNTVLDHKREKIRVAIIGGGVSGLSTALQLSPLVERGIIQAPIDLYEKCALTDIHPHEKSSVIDEHFHPGSGTVGRDIGVGIWSTALEAFAVIGSRYSKDGTRAFNLIEKLEHLGNYVGEVGYRTPNGSWLTRSSLNLGGIGSDSDIDSDIDSDTQQNQLGDPSLLFIKENMFLSSLREAVAFEEQELGTIQTHYATNNSTKSTSNGNGNSNANSGSSMCTEVDYLILDTQSERNSKRNGNVAISTTLTANLQFVDKSTSPQSYHLIIDAGGMQSTLRTKYAGYEALIKKWKKLGATAMPTSTCEQSNSWDQDQLKEYHSIVDRKYVVFRGNAPVTSEEAGGVSFQTWGEGKHMRFAAVGMSHPNVNANASADSNSNRSESQVWFATICDAQVCSSKDAEERKRLLIENFKQWHDPICHLIESTPADKIFMERGVGHKHSMNQSVNIAEVIDYKTRGDIDSSSGILSKSGGPILLFVGDASMTVDPVLAQGFTTGMEAAADLAATLQSSCANIANSDKKIDYAAIKASLVERNKRRFERVMCLVRSTELVQFMAQPSSDLEINVSKYLVRPAMMLVPSFIKEFAFTTMMKYSLGYYGKNKLNGSSSTKP